MNARLTFPSGDYAPERITLLVLRGSIVAVVLLSLLLVIYNALAGSIRLDEMFWIVIVAIVYLFAARYFLKKQRQNTANWMLIIFYTLVACCTLLIWGLNAPIGILTISFAVILPSILMGYRPILPVVGLVIISLITVQLLHANKFINPNLQALSHPSTLGDLFTYSTILAVFAFVSWAAGNQREKNLKRALQAEATLRAQKDVISAELENESANLRLAQMKEIRQLYNFALLGQSTAATLHELSNHLSILNLDIDDLRQQHSNSAAIANAKHSIDAINKMVRQTRQQLNTYDQKENFNAVSVINQSVKDLRPKFIQRQVKLVKHPTSGAATFTVIGNPLALMQVVTVLLNNALDACCDSHTPKVEVAIKNTEAALIISVSDNGPGLESGTKTSLFKPKVSTKTTGLGVGLYIARHLVVSQFKGTLKLARSKTGARFVIRIPRIYEK